VDDKGDRIGVRTIAREEMQDVTSGMTGLLVEASK